MPASSTLESAAHAHHESQHEFWMQVLHAALWFGPGAPFEHAKLPASSAVQVVPPSLTPELEPETPELEPETPELEPETPELEPETPELEPETPELEPVSSPPPSAPPLPEPAFDELEHAFVPIVPNPPITNRQTQKASFFMSSPNLPV
jgi:hypothetical protein